MFEFKLGTHILPHIEKTDVPLFISFRQLRKRKKKKFNQKGSICVDSGGFSELSLFGKWTIKPKEYIDELKRLENLNLNFEWVAQQDLMCENIMLQKTGLTIEQHQNKTVSNFETLRSIEHDFKVIPVLQGQTIKEYMKCFEKFETAGFNLKQEPIVGIGSVCRRNSSNEIFKITKKLYEKGLKLHGFGVKSSGLKRYGKYLKSSDSLAWSSSARYKPPCLNCSLRKVKNCANCLDFALKWRSKVMASIPEASSLIGESKQSEIPEVDSPISFENLFHQP